MPKQVMKSSLAAKLGDKGRKAHEAHKADPVEFGMVNLPAGISGGVARMVMAKWGEFKPGSKYPGQPFVTLQAVVVSPEELNGMKVAGLRASITIPLCDTPEKKEGRQTFEDHYAELLNEFKKLGVDVSEVGFDDIESILAVLKGDDAPFTKFSTREWTPPPTDQNKKPTPMVFTSFDGKCEWEGSDGEAVVDETEEAVEEETEAEEGEDLAALAKAADGPKGGNKKAQAWLKETALEAGILEATIDDADNWAAVVELINDAGNAEEAEAEEESEEETPDEEPEADWKPVVGEVYLWKPPKAKKAVDVEITAVSDKKQTVSIKRLDDNKPFKDVPWNKLESA